ncbi:predicted protein [Naegleria gruberi]|uniref:Predicted protein n=1 Tax=Naegleria gruberi TaxID=5762 RepID=D2VKP2_NAEGR|nr:uncharacterized protein NAEGRDRAFT_69463 [Naegleria gruberi]EFC42630.1 predicted protein [Naegleria gruberi]|eukprot:XP_002675374.1 predicted protein [Naegleria gruberi strain NEG-M]
MEDRPVHLNVGGKIITVSLLDLTNTEREPNNLFIRMFRGELPLYETASPLFSDKVYFINCDHKPFRHVLKWLRYGRIDQQMVELKADLLDICKQYRLEKLEKSISQINVNDCIYDLSFGLGVSSTIIQFKEVMDLFKRALGCETPPKLLYRASNDGFTAQSFHQKCDHQGKTVTIVRSEYGNIFGGFTSQDWESPKQAKFKADPAAFVFKFESDSAGNSRLEVFHIRQGDQKAIYCDAYDLAIFGGGCDFYISDSCNINSASYSEFGDSYELPLGYSFGSEQTHVFLGGKFDFRVSEIEVFKID